MYTFGTQSIHELKQKVTVTLDLTTKVRNNPILWVLLTLKQK
jgi:hypothetical protein